MDRCAHASSFVRITHSLQRVVCTLGLGSKSRTTVLGSARQNKSPQSRWPSIHASLSFHIIFSLSSSAAPFHLHQFRNQIFISGDNSPTIYIYSKQLSINNENSSSNAQIAGTSHARSSGKEL